MRTRGPMLTLLAVLAVGLAVFAVNTVLAGGPDDEPAVTTTAQSGSTGADGYGAPAGAPTAQAPQVRAAAPEAAAPQGTRQQGIQQQGTRQATPAVSDAAFAGRSAGNEVTVAMGVEGDKVVAYVCDGKKVESWFEGTVNGGKLQLSGVDGDLTADATDQAVFGTVAVGDRSWPFSAQPEDTPAGAATDRTVLKKLGTA
ncbi:hypothetical protein LWC35_05255 [Pseudonocardia kujensis]|uniref:hypothetical protein n=1 Tax=Pseudonocardia kujensis TaxID=1128675 RepID=UPI001E401BAD|nr:hypothetical protein [Pseudonocardia kujensis]MCE0762321.1 hypothetical protein [Pseudonocardia kujensis]